MDGYILANCYHRESCENADSTDCIDCIRNVQGKVDNYSYSERGCSITVDGENYTRENSYYVGEVLYMGKHHTLNVQHKGFKVIDENGDFKGLLSTRNHAIWNVDESSLRIYVKRENL